MAEQSPQTLSNFGREVPLDDLFAFYAHLGLSKELAYKPQAGAEIREWYTDWSTCITTARNS